MPEHDTQRMQKQPANPLQNGPSVLLRRRCACGSHTQGGGECRECNKDKLRRSAKANEQTATFDVPSIVHEVLRSPGETLDRETRSFMESSFGRDFSRVRVHSDARAAESAQAVSAEAYTVGSNIVFGAGRLSPHTSAGRNLLAHELAHVVQQEHVSPAQLPTRIGAPGDSAESNADQLSQAALTGGQGPAAWRPPASQISRQVIPSVVHCTASSDGAPADPVARLTTDVALAEVMLVSAALLLRLTAALTRAGSQPVGTPAEQAFNNRFGEPPEVSGGFMNRFTGAVRPTLEIALAEEMEHMATRYQMIANELRHGLVHYICMTTGPRSFGGCTIGACTRDAFACPNVNAIFLCPGFWTGPSGTDSTLLIHETAHMIWERVFHGAAGSGGNFRHAECYASFVGDLFGLPPGAPACPPT